MQTNELVTQIDHTLLKPESTPRDVERLCDEALEYGFAAVCVMPLYVPLAAKRLAGTPVQVATVIGFPLGASSTFVKAVEARDAVAAGAHELDMVMQIGALKAGDTRTVLDDIQAVVKAAEGRTVKVILETALLTPDEITQACTLAKQAGANFVKTSTGFGPGGATEEAVRLMRQAVGEGFGVKASGGIRSKADAIRMVQAGANRLGTSAGVAIAQAREASGGAY